LQDGHPEVDFVTIEGNSIAVYGEGLLADTNIQKWHSSGAVVI